MVSAFVQKFAPWLVLLACVGLSGCTANQAGAEARLGNVAPSALPTVTYHAASAGSNNSTMTPELIALVQHDVHIEYIIAMSLFEGTSNSSMKLQYTETFPFDYDSALIELAWSPTYPTNQQLSLMLHQAGSMLSMLEEVNGPSPLKFEVFPDIAEPGRPYDLVVFVPSDGRTQLVVDQDAMLYASFFRGTVPPGYSAIP